MFLKIVTYVQYSFDLLFRRWTHSKVVRVNIFLKRWSMGKNGSEPLFQSISSQLYAALITCDERFEPQCKLQIGDLKTIKLQTKT